MTTETMSNTLQAIHESRRVAKIRMGQAAPNFVTLRSNEEVRMAMVPLLEREYQQSLDLAASMEAPDNPYGIEMRDRTLQVCTLMHALREPDDPSERVFATTNEVVDNLEPTDINYLMENYTQMIEFSSPALDGVSDEELEQLKKALLTIEWNALSGKPWWHLKQFLSTLPVLPPLAKSPSPTSTQS